MSSAYVNPEYFPTLYHEYAFVATGMLAQFMNVAGVTQTQTILEKMTKTFHADAQSENWLVASFPLVGGACIIMSGKLGDIYGLRRMALVGYLVAAVWAILCGAARYARSANFYIVARAFQGLGLALLVPNVMGIVGNVYKPGSQRKNVVVSLVAACAPIGASAGVFFSGVLGQYADWAWSGFLYGIVMFINLLVGYWCIPKQIPVNSHKLKMDWIGCALGVSGLVLFDFVWNQGPVVGWDTHYVIALVPVSVVVLAAFAVWEVRYAAEPLIPHEAMKNWRIGVILVIGVFGWGSFAIWTFYYYQLLLNLRHYSPMWAGGTTFMMIVFGVIAALTVGATIRFVRPHLMLLMSSVAFLCGVVMLAVTPVHQSFFRISMGQMIILPFGMDMSFPASTIILSNILPFHHQGMAGSLVATIINYSQSVCIGVGVTVQRYSHPKDTLQGYRNALYCGIGIAGTGVLIAALFLIHSYFEKGDDAKKFDNVAVESDGETANEA